MMAVSLQPREQWANGIFENSPHMRFSIYRNGTVEQFQVDYRIPKKFRKAKARSLEQAVQKINAYLDGLSNRPQEQVRQDFERVATGTVAPSGEEYERTKPLRSESQEIVDRLLAS
jgi:hypothetical protein